MDLEHKARALPSSPGVYLFKNPEGSVIYVGKAKDLHARLRTYFLPESLANSKTGSLLREAAELESIVVDSEAEALALENSLIKRLQPRFNVLLRDDKTYPYIRLSREAYPRVYVTRRLDEPDSEYFGPFFPARLAYRMVHFVNKHFLVPSCRVDLSHFHPRPCLQYHLHRCLGPCVEGLTTPARYAEAVADARLFLAGRHGDLARDLRQRRDAAAADLQFERAAGFRDLLSVLEDLQERQKMHALTGQDADIAGFHREGARAALDLFHLRHGRVVDRREYFWEDLDEDLSDSAILGQALKQIYLSQPYVPPHLSVPAEFEDRELLASVAKVEIFTPQRGAKKELLDLAARNARHSFDRRFRRQAPDRWAQLAAALELPLDPANPRIECFDISHFQGAETVASLVVWEGGRMRPGQYRKFRIRDTAGVDDFASMAEVVRRRYQRLLEAGAPLPGLVLIDGGIGQLHAAQRVLAELGLDRLPLAALAKREELVYIPGREASPVALPETSPARQLLQMVRDEAHRFALTFHRLRRGKASLRSDLLQVPGVGPATVKRLLAHLGSLSAVQAASPAELAAVIAPTRAQSIWSHLHPAHNAEASPPAGPEKQ